MCSARPKGVKKQWFKRSKNIAHFLDHRNSFHFVWNRISKSVQITPTPAQRWQKTLFSPCCPQNNYYLHVLFCPALLCQVAIKDEVLSLVFSSYAIDCSVCTHHYKCQLSINNYFNLYHLSIIGFQAISFQQYNVRSALNSNAAMAFQLLLWFFAMHGKW